MILTISGLHGTGKSTIAKLITEKLGLQYYSTGQAFRDLAQEMNMTLEKFSEYAEKNPEIDKELDSKIIGIARKGNIIIDSQLSGYILKSIADFKILLICPLEIRIKRMAERDNVNYKLKLRETEIREKSELERFKHLYNIDLSDQEEIQDLYDLIIDTENLTIEDVLEKILSTLE
ncbi:MAG: AAA family ATPase [Candidatus Lokiarchaeota archaeon]|nr:AAA family ATPase [Candidatus Lokiarchaeota archaeon]TKJ19068.1 MAG: cytidylate kinase [Candidatus Lokiarchaeota archaeon Loki_b32]